MKFLVIPHGAGPFARVVDIDRLLQVAAKAGYTVGARGAAYAWEAYMNNEGGFELSTENYSEERLLQVLRLYLDAVEL